MQIPEEEYTEYLMHYGVMGMKWGKRKAQDTHVGRRAAGVSARRSAMKEGWKEVGGGIKRGAKAVYDANNKLAKYNRDTDLATLKSIGSGIKKGGKAVVDFNNKWAKYNRDHDPLWQAGKKIVDSQKGKGPIGDRLKAGVQNWATKQEARYMQVPSGQKAKVLADKMDGIDKKIEARSQAGMKKMNQMLAVHASLGVRHRPQTPGEKRADDLMRDYARAEKDKTLSRRERAAKIKKIQYDFEDAEEQAWSEHKAIQATRRNIQRDLREVKRATNRDIKKLRAEQDGLARDIDAALSAAERELRKAKL